MLFISLQTQTIFYKTGSRKNCPCYSRNHSTRRQNLYFMSFTRSLSFEELESKAPDLPPPSSKGPPVSPSQLPPILSRSLMVRCPLVRKSTPENPYLNLNLNRTQNKYSRDAENLQVTGVGVLLIVKRGLTITLNSAFCI